MADVLDILVTFAQSITCESIIFVIYMIYELIRQGVKRVLPSHYPTWQAELVLESHHSCAYFKINGVQRIRLRFDVCTKP